MPEKQKQILEKVADAYSNMTEFNKGYMACLIENNSSRKKGEENHESTGRK